MVLCFTPRFSPLGSWPNVSLHAVRGEIRKAFTRWGLPARLRVDNGTPWGSWGEFPTDLSLWLIGLNITMHWNNACCPQENGVVEHSQGTSARWCEPWTCESPEELQKRLGRVTRKVDSTGQVSLYGRGHYVGRIHRKKEVHVMYDPNRNEWVISDRDGTQLRNLPADWLSRQSVVDMEVTRRRK